jgi:Protein of unknown function (DUF5661)
MLCGLPRPHYPLSPIALVHRWVDTVAGQDAEDRYGDGGGGCPRVTDVTGDDPILTGKIALAHMKEFPDYYERLERMEEAAARDWATKAP